MKTVLILDDDKSQLNYLSNLLESDFRVHTTNSPLSAFNIFQENQFDAIIVDVHMPIINGFEFIRSIKDQKNCFNSALFILSSDTSMQTKIEALNLGVKDFLWPEMTKEEIILRIKNQILPKNISESQLVKTYKDLKVELLNLTAFHSDKKLDLTLIEFKILSFLISNATRVVTREELKDFTWPEAIVLDKTLNTHMTNLRSKLSESDVEIKSVKGEGILMM